MLIRTRPVTITTDTNGAATVYIGSCLRGKLLSIIYRPGGDSGLDTGADLTITAEQNQNPVPSPLPAGTPILTKFNLGTGNSFLYPRVKPTDAGSATGALGTVVSEFIPLCGDRLKVVVAQGGNTKTGTIEAIYDSESANAQ